MISYDPEKTTIRVRLDGKFIGTIVKAANVGWYYIPRNHSERGDLFDTVSQVKQSLEAL